MKTFKKNRLSLVITAAGLAFATTVPVQALDLEEIVVTASPRAVSKMDSTVSINTVSAEDMQAQAPRSAAEILRTIPGIRSESSAGEGNTNIAVRGVPVGAGGSKFVQLQEDGLPILQFGDIIVGTSDQFLRVDGSVGNLEALKGSTAATLASNAPAGIINFISKTGQDEGGSVAVSTGLDYDSYRTDFEYGGPMGANWRFHIGGFYREGEGAREVGFNASKGGQIKANVTREFEKGFIRFYGKFLDDQVPTYLPMPMTADQNSIPGMDALTASNITSDLSDVLSVGPNGGGRHSSLDSGNHSKSTALGFELDFEVADGLIVNNKFRYSQNSGTFFGAFSASIGDATDPEAISVALEGAGADGLAYISGPNAGEVLSAAELANLNGNGLIQNIRTFDNDLESLDSFSNNLSITKSFDTFDLTFGYYKGTQDIDVNWYWQTFIQDVSDDPRLMDAYAGGQQLTQNGQLAFGAPDWGNCCTRDTALEADIDAFYIAAHLEATEALTIDASVRYDEGDATGHYTFGNTIAFDMNHDGVTGGPGQLAEESVTFIDQTQINSSRFEYDWDYFSYSLAANFNVTDALSLFGSASRGTRVNADRLGDGGFLENGTATAGSVENELTSYEFGVKFGGDLVDVFATMFYVETDDSNSEPKDGGEARIREYESLGLELEANTQLGENFDITGTLTWTDAEIVGAPGNEDIIGNTPRRQADFAWSVAPRYYMGEHSVGLTIVGTTDAYDQDDNTYELDGYIYANLFASLAVAEGLTLQLSVNNITDEIGVTEKEGGSHMVNGVEYIRARSIAGRTTELKLQYNF